jgi:hypothetical protein
MKKISFILALTFASISLLAQEDSIPTNETKVKVQEVGVAFSNFDNFGLTYKIGNQKSLWRFYALYFSGDNSKEDRSTQYTKYNDYGFGIKIGKEFRKNIVSNLEFRYGFDLLFNYTYSKELDTNDDPDMGETTIKSTRYLPGIDFVIGLNYVIKDKLVLGIEVLPYFSYRTGKNYFISTASNIPEERTTKISGFSYGLSNSSALLTVAYRF